MHEELGFHPYALMVVQKLNKRDYQQQLNFACKMITLYEKDDNMILLMSDAHFYLNGAVNKQNCQ